MDFSRQLINSGDLDPVYLALPKAVDDQPHLFRWLVAYWYFYDCGFASWISEREGASYWEAMNIAAENTLPTPFGGRWPRAKERRHFRGGAATRSVAQLQKMYGNHPEKMVEAILSGPMDITSVINRAKEHPLIGGWSGFKVADMIDAVVGEPVAQNDVTVFLYETPRKSILENWRRQMGYDENVTPKDEDGLMRQAMTWIGDELKDCTIPHKPGETLDLFSLETCWCKHKSHMGGSYPLLNDLHEIVDGVRPWMEFSSTAKAFAHNMPAVS